MPGGGTVHVSPVQMCGSMTSHTWPGRDVSQLPSVPIKVSTPSLDYMILGHFHTSDFPSSDLLKDLTIAALFL